LASSDWSSTILHGTEAGWVAVLQSSSSLRQRMLDWSQGVGWRTCSGGLPQVRDVVWRAEARRRQRRDDAATTIQATWRGHRQLVRYETYRLGREDRVRRRRAALLSLWRRACLQRPSEARSALSQARILTQLLRIRRC
jgi:hypothetical protein